MDGYSIITKPMKARTKLLHKWDVQSFIGRRILGHFRNQLGYFFIHFLVSRIISVLKLSAQL